MFVMTLEWTAAGTLQKGTDEEGATGATAVEQSLGSYWMINSQPKLAVFPTTFISQS